MSLSTHGAARLSLSLLLFLLAFEPGMASVATAECTVLQAGDGKPGYFARALSPDCSDEERLSQAVPADELLAALKEGKHVDLAGIVLLGDLHLDRLPVIPRKRLADMGPAVVAAAKPVAGDIRVISGSLAIRNSRVSGVIVTNLNQGTIVVKGPVSMAGTTFERAVDFSRSMFLEPVDFSGAVFLNEGLFTRATFQEEARFEKTGFGHRVRFHKARFQDAATFFGAVFGGMAEFIEVSFEKDASFSQTRFKLGSGFSGTRFGGMLDFSEALFEREAYFRYSVFGGDAYFRRSTFRALADFSYAEFRGLDDFSKVLFEGERRFTGAIASGGGSSPGGLQDPRIMYAVAGLLAVFTILLLFTLRKR